MWQWWCPSFFLISLSFGGLCVCVCVLWGGGGGGVGFVIVLFPGYLHLYFYEGHW